MVRRKKAKKNRSATACRPKDSRRWKRQCVTGGGNRYRIILGKSILMKRYRIRLSTFRNFCRNMARNNREWTRRNANRRPSPLTSQFSPSSLCVSRSPFAGVRGKWYGATLPVRGRCGSHFRYRTDTPRHSSLTHFFFCRPEVEVAVSYSDLHPLG